VSSRSTFRPRERRRERGVDGAHTSRVSSPISSAGATSKSETEGPIIDMKTTNDVRLGTRGPSVFPIALGCMGMGAGSWYGDSDEAESVATIHEAIERGVDVL